MDKENSPDDFPDNDLCANNKLHPVFLIIIIQIIGDFRTDEQCWKDMEKNCLTQSLDLVLTRWIPCDFLFLKIKSLSIFRKGEFKEKENTFIQDLIFSRNKHISRLILGFKNAEKQNGICRFAWFLCLTRRKIRVYPIQFHFLDSVSLSNSWDKK